MEWVGQAVVDEVIEAWVRAEIDSSRFGPRLGELLARDGRDRADLEDPACRLKLLTDFRGTAPTAHTAPAPEADPADPGQIHIDGLELSRIDWWRAVVTRAELSEIRYINWGYWLDMTNGSRRPPDFIRQLDFVPRFDQELHHSAAALRQIVNTIQNGIPPPPMILVDSGPGTRVVVLEGHFRLTAYVMAGATAPERIDVLFGRSPQVADWSDY